MLRSRALLVSAVVAANALLLVACAPALDFDSLTRSSKADASADGPVDAPQDDTSLIEAAGDSSTTADGGTDSATDAPAADAAEEYGDPCTNVSAANNGWYCGRSMQSGFSGGSPLELYHCVNGAASATSCPNGCIIAPPTYEDECDYCNLNADGTYCGSQFGYMMPSDRLLIVCSGGHVPDGGITPCGTSCVLDGGAHCGP